MSNDFRGSNKNARLLERIAERFFVATAATFPVCAASDEFYFFPQPPTAASGWGWDDFSPASVSRFADRLQDALAELQTLDKTRLSCDQQVDFELLAESIQTLREQLLLVAPHQRQPTFHLTILAAGLAEALSASDPSAWATRAAGVPRFLQRAADCLQEIPGLFKTVGAEMLADLRSWLAQLEKTGRHVSEILAALARFEEILREAATRADLLLEETILDRLVVAHIGCHMSPDEVRTLLEAELQEMTDLVLTESSRLAPACSWIEAGRRVPFCPAPDNDLLELYRPELSRLEAHCRAQGFIPESLPGAAGLQLAKVPEYLAAIRASDAYAARPGHPPRGGTFFVMSQDSGAERVQGRSLEYRLTAVHETWPGHHLLDSSRWVLSHPLRRPLEQPLFYEGWACLAEELMARTGYLDHPWDRYLLAKRRLERAVRGLIDLDLQTGRLSIAAAEQRLVAAGYRPSVARSVVPKYLLRPGYQLCYTCGLKQGLQLFETFGQADPGRFVRTVLTEGEIGFSRLARVFDRQRSH